MNMENGSFWKNSDTLLMMMIPGPLKEAILSLTLPVVLVCPKVYHSPETSRYLR